MGKNVNNSLINLEIKKHSIIFVDINEIHLSYYTFVVICEFNRKLTSVLIWQRSK